MSGTVTVLLMFTALALTPLAALGLLVVIGAG
jgi:hypothetical protein